MRCDEISNGVSQVRVSRARGVWPSEAPIDRNRPDDLLKKASEVRQGSGEMICFGAGQRVGAREMGEKPKCSANVVPKWFPVQFMYSSTESAASDHIQLSVLLSIDNEFT